MVTVFGQVYSFIYHISIALVKLDVYNFQVAGPVSFKIDLFLVKVNFGKLKNYLLIPNFEPLPCSTLMTTRKPNLLREVLKFLNLHSLTPNDSLKLNYFKKFQF